MAQYQSEAELENKLIKKLQEMEYEYVEIKDYPALKKNFRKQLGKVNKKVLNGEDLTDTEFKRLMTQLDGLTAFQAAKLVRDKLLLDRDNGEKIHLSLFDKYSENNIYQVSHQIKNENFKHQGQVVRNRYDVTILINGLPFVQIELKRAGIEINEAINQISRYHLESFKGLFKFITMFVVSNGNETKYFANTDQKHFLKSLTFYWTMPDNSRVNNLESFSCHFFNKMRLTKILQKYTILSDANKAIMIMRPYQIYAVESFVKRVKDTNKNAYVAHCTGSGKTLTSFKLSQILKADPTVDKIFFLIDRRDLDVKTIDDFNSYKKGSIDMTNNTSQLVENIKNKHQKLIVTTIQKMANAINRESYRRGIEPYRDGKIIFIIDECHRSQFGKMHADITRFFKNAQYFGFTGTPRYSLNCAEGERTTKDIFEKCLHQYLMINAIHDHNVLGFNLEYLATYKGQYTENDPYKDCPEKLKEIYESDERVETITNYIFNHHCQKTVQQKYTAIFATSSIEMLIKYYYQFKIVNSNQRLKIGAVFSYAPNENVDGKDKRHKEVMQDIIADYNKITESNFSLDTYDKYNLDISKRLQKKSSQPFLDILIVVDQYLTGFDSKPTNTLYVDKNLKYHGLVQAFSRTNRVFETNKQFGNIVCFRNLKKETDEALKLFNGGENANIDDIFCKSYEEYAEVFAGNVAALKGLCPTVDKVDDLISEKDIKKFVYAFRDLANTVSALETYVDFSWDKEEICSQLRRQEFEDFKGRYRQIYEEMKEGKEFKKSADDDEISLSDLDFKIELIQTDKINAFYLMNLVRNINFENEEQKEKDIQFILEELGRTDNANLKQKEEVVRKFVEEVVRNLDNAENIDELYLAFESQMCEDEIYNFAEDINLEPKFVQEFVNEYNFSHYINKNEMRDKLKEKNLGYKETKERLTKISSFIEKNSKKYSKY